MRSRFATIAIAAVLLMLPSAAFADSPTADDEQLYAKTITTMRDLPEPPYLTFVFNVTLRGEISTALLENHGFAVFRIWSGKAKGQPSGSWATSHRASDDLGSVANTPQSHLLAKSPIFNPTWTGAYDWLRFGLKGRPPIPKSSPQPSTESDKQLKVIGYVKALGPSAYRISAANPARCPGGQEGRHLQLVARRGDVWVHPLTEVTIDLASTRFCSMRFHSPVNGAGGVSFAELHFGIVNGYWVTTNVDTDWRGFGPFGIGGRAEWHITYDDMRLPDKLDDALFSLPDGAEAR
ncbi:MAG: hypothetical protein M3N13_06240 [Candidatus Eremiobacteraeota bacterium]|nr:hypothetical protein [Candidatus Eremiobacteraeota bacterium]